jgi:uncharacterized membrane protein (DUF373 family)
MKMPQMKDVFNIVIKVIVIILTLIIVAVMVIGLIQTVWEIKDFFISKSVGQSFNAIVVNLLTFLVIIELFRSFTIYFETHRFRLSTMIDPAIVFVIRELIVKLYTEKDMPWETIVAFGFLLLCMGIIRSLAVKYSPRDETREDKHPLSVASKTKEPLKDV